MDLPKKALKESQLKKLASSVPQKDGSHDITQVIFIENGVEVLGFFKRIDPQKNYPQLLAKISVAVSVFRRLFQGASAAEERLVFDDKDQLVGTLSLAIPEFRPFNYKEDTAPSKERSARVIPETALLLRNNIIKILFGRWFLNDDDTHPHNLGFKDGQEESVDIDYDMSLYWLTVIIKGSRPLIESKTQFELSTNDWETFPIINDARPYHWPTFERPGEKSFLDSTYTGPFTGPVLKQVLPKAYADPSQFRRLAGEKVAHEQKFAAALSALLTFDPPKLRELLYEQFGELALNYTSLDSLQGGKRQQYERLFPYLFNTHTNKGSFIDFIMAVYQIHYDNLYRLVVFYQGVANNQHGLPLPATYSALFYKPSYYREIQLWAKAQNESLRRESTSCESYALEAIQKRYHQIWRDAHGHRVKTLFEAIYKLTIALLLKTSSDKDSVFCVSECEKDTDILVTKAWDLFGSLPEIPKELLASLISVDEGSSLRQAVMQLVQLINKFHEALKEYYSKEPADLTEEDNWKFSRQLHTIYEEYYNSIRTHLSYTTTNARHFNDLARQLKQLAEQVDFKHHLTTTDEMMKSYVEITMLESTVPHTHYEELKKFNDALFDWAKLIKAEELNQYVFDIIDRYYAPSSLVATLWNTRHRAQPVKQYLSSSMDESGDNRLAYILSSGTCELGQLNLLLIEHLTPRVLQTYPIPSMISAVKDLSFKNSLTLLTKGAVEHARFDSRFTHLYSARGIKLFYEALYDWADSLSSQEFKIIIDKSLAQYEASLSFFNRGPKREEILKDYSAEEPAKSLALIFLKGVGSTYNSALFDKLVEACKAVTEKSQEQHSQGHKLILRYEQVEKEHCIQALQAHALAPSQRQKITPIPAVA